MLYTYDEYQELKAIINFVACHIADMDRDDMTQAEKTIAKRLEREGFLTFEPETNCYSH